MTGLLGVLGGKILAAIMGAAIVVSALAYVRHVRSENVRLETEKAVLVRNIDLLRANAALAMKFTQRQAVREDALRIETDKALQEVRRVRIPKLTPSCEVECARTYDPVRCAFGLCPPPDDGRAAPVPGVQEPRSAR